MRVWKVLGIAAVIGGGVAGAILLAPSAQGQVVFRSDGDGDRRHIEVFGGAGSRIGVSVRDIEQSDAQREKYTLSLHDALPI